MVNFIFFYYVKLLYFSCWKVVIGGLIVVEYVLIGGFCVWFVVGLGFLRFCLWMGSDLSEVKLW